MTVVHPGFSENSLNIYLLELMNGGLTPVETVSLDVQAKEIPFNLRLTPIFICFEALMVGFILGGALMLAEKQDGTVRALRVAPFGAAKYILARRCSFH